MSSLFSRLSAILLVLTCAGVTACSAGDRANGTLPTPAVRLRQAHARAARIGQANPNDCFADEP